MVQVFFAFWVEINWCFGGGAMGQKFRAPFEGENLAISQLDGTLFGD